MLTDSYKPNYKAFLFTHTSLAPIHSTVQRGHCIAEMFVKYKDRKDGTGEAAGLVLYDWAKNYKTLVIRDGGTSKDLHSILEILQIVCPTVNSPYAFFNESNDFMEGMLTSVGFVLDRNAAESTLYTGYSIPELLEISISQLKGNGLSQSEAYGILVALIDASRPAR